MRPLLSALLLDITRSYSLRSKLSNACCLRVSASLWDLFIIGSFWIKLVVIFRHSNTGLSCCQNTLVNISASGNISSSCIRTISAPHQSFIQSQTIATFLLSRLFKISINNIFDSYLKNIILLIVV